MNENAARALFVDDASGYSSPVSRMGGERPDFVFVHLSDIHFRAGRAGDLHDPDADLRNELEFDLRNAGDLVPQIDALIVSGDIAFAGQASEYQTAAAWLKSIGEQVSCPQERVLVTPGNHDVNRNDLPPGCPMLTFHEEVQRAASLEDRDAKLANCMRDPVTGAALFAPLAEYNAFATAYGCAVGPDNPYWERYFSLGDGSQLCIRGMSTTLISGPRDDLMPQNLAYAAGQRTFLRMPGVRRMVVGHHPPSWTSEGDSAAEAFAKRNLVQLFGHRHAQWIAREENSVRIIAGAVHPDPREPSWEPRYNIVTLSLLTPTSMKVRVFPRKWSREEMMFVPDHLGNGAIDRERVLEIEKFERPAQVQVPRTTHTGLVKWGAIAERLRQAGPAAIDQLATELGVFIKPEERSLPMRLVSAAVTAGKLDDLESKLAAIEALRTETPGSER